MITNLLAFSLAISDFSLSLTFGVALALLNFLENIKISYTQIYLAAIFTFMSIYFLSSWIGSEGFELFYLPVLSTCFLVAVIITDKPEKTDNFDLALVLFFCAFVYFLVEIRVWETLLNRPENIAKFYSKFGFSPNRLSAAIGFFSFLVITAPLKSNKNLMLIAIIGICLVVNFGSRFVLVILFIFALDFMLFQRFLHRIFGVISLWLLFPFFAVALNRMDASVFVSDNRFLAFENAMPCMQTAAHYLLGNAHCLASVGKNIPLDNYFALMFFASGFSGLVLVALCFFLLFYYCRLRGLQLVLALVYASLIYSFDESIGKPEFLLPILLGLILRDWRQRVKYSEVEVTKV